MTSSAPPPARLVVLASDGEANVQTLLEACTLGVLQAQVVAVISDSADSASLERARRAGIPGVTLPGHPNETRYEYDAALSRLAAGFEPDWVVLAGWSRSLSNIFLSRFPRRVINLHPALPGAFPGFRAIERAYRAYHLGQVNHTGVSVHFLPDEGGPALAQEVVPIFSDDTLPALAARIHTTEHALLVSTLQQLCGP